MSGKLNPKQKQFAKEYTIDFNATQAAKRCGYSEKTAASQGGRLLQHVDVQLEIAKQIDKRAKKTEITAERVLLEYAKIAFADVKNMFDGKKLKSISDMDDDTSASISSVDMNKSGHKYKMHDKIRALEALGRHTGLFDKSGAGDTVIFNNVNLGKSDD